MARVRWYYDHPDDGIVEWTNVIPVMHARDEPGTDGLVVDAEQGSIGRARIRIEDPTSSINVVGFRKVWAVEEDAIADEFGGVIAIYYTFIAEIVEGSPFDGIGRVWEVQLDDLNSVLERRIMEGSDAKRPAETDVARAQWLFATAEMAFVESDLYLSTADPVSMDAADLRGQRVQDIWHDLSQESGKNFYLRQIVGDDDLPAYAMWYGHDGLDTFASIAAISNDPASIDPDHASAPVYSPAARQTKLTIDPSRIWSGARVNYDGGSVYVTRPPTAAQFGPRDTIVPAENVKTANQAKARGNRYLRDARTPEHVIDTAIVVPAARVNVVTWGHLVPFDATWLADQGYADPVDVRVMKRTPRVIGEGKYEIKLTLSPGPLAPGAGAGAGGAACTGLTPSGSFYPLGGEHVEPFGGSPFESDGKSYYLRPGISFPIEPTPGHLGSWHFPVFNAGGFGTVDYAGSLCQNRVRCMVVGDGVMTIHTTTGTEGPISLRAILMHHQYGVGEEGNPHSGSDIVDQVWSGIAGGTDIEVDVSTHGGLNCTHWVDVIDDGPGGQAWGYEGFDWEAAS